MAIVTLYRSDDLSGNIKADTNKFIVGDDGVRRNESTSIREYTNYTS